MVFSFSKCCLEDFLHQSKELLNKVMLCLPPTAMKVLGVRLKYFMPGMMALYFVCDSLGVFVHLWELDYYFEFSYPLEGDLQVRTAKEEIKIVQSTNLCFCNICVHPMHF